MMTTLTIVAGYLFIGCIVTFVFLLCDYKEYLIYSNSKDHSFYKHLFSNSKEDLVIGITAILAMVVAFPFVIPHIKESIKTIKSIKERKKKREDLNKKPRTTL